MPIFISYSHKDKVFVDRLATQLVQRNVNIWLDRWELSVGDSIMDRIQDAVEGAAALLVVLSRASVTSEWCKKELSAGLLRELEEKRVVVMPVMLEDCSVPVFARGKKFADFRSDFDTGLTEVIEGIAKVTTPSQGRFVEPEYHVDWSIDWGDVNGCLAIILTYVQLPERYPYTCLTNVEILANNVATKLFNQKKVKVGVEYAKLDVLAALCESLKNKDELKPRVSNEREQVCRLSVSGLAFDEKYSVRIGVRRLGEDTGRDVIVNVSSLILNAYQHMNNVLSKKN
jgi:hypothetical protein